MRAIILNGSARGARGVTGKLVTSLAAGLTKGGTEVVQFEVGSLHISPCTACLSCMLKTQGVCTKKDDMENIYRALKIADVLIVAAPVYLDTIPAQLKAVMDRCICCMQPSLVKDRAGKGKT